MSTNDLIANEFVIAQGLVLPIVIAVIICLFSFVLYLSWSERISYTKRTLEKLIDSLGNTEYQGMEILNHSIEVTDDQQIKNLLTETRDNLVSVEGDLGTELYSIRSYSDIWTARDVLTGKMNLSLFETMPNILIGLGLMFTFIFLAWALTDAGVAMGGDSSERDDAMKSLIANAGGKFITSIVGLFSSLLWNWRAKVEIDRLQSSMAKLHVALRKVAPDTASQAIVRRQHSLLQELLAENREQVGQLKRFETDVALAIAKAIGNELQPSFKTLGTELVEAIKELTNRIGNMNEDALQKMIEQFIEQFRGTSSDEMQEFKSALTSLAQKLESAGDKIGGDFRDAGETFGSATSNLESAINTAHETVVRLDESLDKAGSVISEGSDRFEVISDKLFANLTAVDGLLVGVDIFLEKIQSNIETLEGVAESLDDTVASQSAISQEFKEAIPKMSKALADSVLEISSSSKVASEALSSIRLELENTKNSVDETVVSLTTGVDQYTDKVRDLHVTLDGNIGNAISKIGTAVQDLNDTMDEFLEAFTKK
jgi:uncharacterized protein YoxC